MQTLTLSMINQKTNVGNQGQDLSNAVVFWDCYLDIFTSLVSKKFLNVTDWKNIPENEITGLEHFAARITPSFIETGKPYANQFYPAQAQGGYSPEQAQTFAGRRA
jgi:hypothetical protein